MNYSTFLNMFDDYERKLVIAFMPIFISYDTLKTLDEWKEILKEGLAFIASKYDFPLTNHTLVHWLDLH